MKGKKNKKKEEIGHWREAENYENLEMAENDESLEDKQIVIINNIESPESGSPLVRSVALYGDLTEEGASDIVQSLFFLRDHAHPPAPEEDEESLKEEKDRKTIDFLISTRGGVAAEMFAVYDAMNMIKKNCDISTIGMGKVMSAGVLLLASGTKGKRKISANCRVMIHSVNGGYNGSLLNMENEISEVRWIQHQYVKTLAAETKMSEKKIRRFLKKHVDVYLSAKEAVKHGIADEVI